MDLTSRNTSSLWSFVRNCDVLTSKCDVTRYKSYTHAYLHKYIHALAHTCLNAETWIVAFARTHAHIHTHTHTYVRTRTHYIHMHAFRITKQFGGNRCVFTKTDRLLIVPCYVTTLDTEILPVEIS